VSLLARAVFVLLVVATFSAFFVAQRLKSAPTVANLRSISQHFSPNDDGRRDVARIRLRIRRDDDVTVSMVDDLGTEVKRLATAVPATPEEPLRLSWDGTANDGSDAPQGYYRVRVSLRSGNRAVTLRPGVNLDLTAPRPTVKVGGPDGADWITGPVAGPIPFRVLVTSRRLPTRIRVYRTAVFVPVVVSTIATVIIFLWVFDPNFGLANWLLGKVGLGPFAFFTSSNGALYSIVAMTVWGWIGFNVIVYLAALQGIPRELVEAAEIDGAGNWGIFRNVTLPLLGPVTLFLVVWSSINALQLFDEVYVTTKGGPLHATTVVVYYVWQQAFVYFHAGYVAAISVLLFVVVAVVTLVQLRLTRDAEDG